MSIRELTEEQFSDGTTVDGSRLAKALDDMGDRFSSVPEGDLAQRHLQTQIVCGWSPPTAASGTSKTNEIRYPWLSPSIPSSEVSGSPYEYPGARFKSTGDDTGVSRGQYAMTVPIQITTPCILQSVNVLMLTNTNGYYKWDIANFGTGNMGPQLLVTVDNPFLLEDHNMSSVVLHRDCTHTSAFDLTGDASDLGVAPLGGLVMSPDWPGATLRGAYLKTEELNIPLAAKARLRFCLFNVLDTTIAYSMWSSFAPSITVTLLEPTTHA